VERITLEGWQIRYDAEATRRAYLARGPGYPEVCGCLDCRNYAAARDTTYRGATLELLERFGIDPSREAEVFATGQVESGLYVYEGWFHFAGVVDVASDPFTTRDPDHGTLFGLFFTAGGALMPETFNGLDVVQLDFRAEVPWVLDVPREHPNDVPARPARPAAEAAGGPAATPR